MHLCSLFTIGLNRIEWNNDEPAHKVFKHLLLEWKQKRELPLVVFASFYIYD